MSFVQDWNWELDMGNMICINEKHQVFVKLVKDGNNLRGRILDISMDLLLKIARLENGPEAIQQIVLAAKAEYWKESLEGYAIEGEN